MNRIRITLISAAILALALLGLVACGGESPTATPVPTATPAPPPPTPTAVQAKEATSDEVKLVNDAVAGAKDYKSYHFTMEVKPSTFITQPVKAEGDYQAPNMVYMKGTIGGRPFENIAVGDKVFQKGTDGQYHEVQKSTDTSDIAAQFSPENITSGDNPLGSISGLTEAVKKYQNVGDESINGVNTKHLAFDLDIAEMMKASGGDTSGIDLSGLGSLGNGSFWINPQDKTIHKLEYNLNVGAIFELMSRAFSMLGGTPTPGGEQPTATPPLEVNLVMVISKHNDPSIKVPVTQEMMQAAAETPTTEPVMEETPQTEATPEEAATPEAGATPESGGGAVTGNVGEPTDIGWAKFTLNKVSRASSGNIDPSAGNEYVIVNVTIENVGSEDDKPISSLLMLKMVDTAEKEYQWALGAKVDLLDSKQTNLKKGDKVTGEVGYEVPKGKTGLVLKFMPDPFFDEKTVLSVPLDK
jgi:hypothetical protein